MSQCLYEEAESILLQVSDIISGIDTTSDYLPAYDVRLFAGKMLLELDNDDSNVDRCEAAINLFDQLLLENDENNELVFLMATAHYNLRKYTLGLEYAHLVETRLKKALKETPDITELHAQYDEVEKLIQDLETGKAQNPDAEAAVEKAENCMEEE